MISLQDDVLAALRGATANRHALLDQAMPLARTAPTLDDYHEHLCLLRPWLAGIAIEAARHSDGPQDPRLLPPLDRLASLDADLADHAKLANHAEYAEHAEYADRGGRAGHADRAAIAGQTCLAGAASPNAAAPQPAAPPTMAAIALDGSAAWRWGVAYVVEGSQLGGIVLHRRLSASLAPHPLRYLHGGGVPPGPRWQLFLTRLRAEVTAPADIAQACAGACAAFDALIARLPQGRHTRQAVAA
ncbi:biliverdin-producing heme oxygenase [Massilia sp. Root418]|uniref:biliverdin-producing heme oxygenase n=1 Tax=Massilia sp. Root418 TaxID=1736532 RepID=UPI000AAD8D85|nr:biliverdin-producing heme oxygenase [Massilia sp. Root418]